MAPHLNIAVEEPSQVGEARRAAVRLAGELGFDEVASGRVAIVVTELGTNLARHAKRGRLLIGPSALGEDSAIDVLSLDHGPGMDVSRCLRDGFSTSGTPGTGLGAVQRLAQQFSVHSVVGDGTVSVARIAARSDGGNGAGRDPLRPPAFAIGAICLAAPGETTSGDGWRSRQRGHRAQLMVADGLGHGPVAAEASDAALSVFDKREDSSPSQIIEHAHLAMRSTRGAAVAVVELDAEAGTVVFSGAGNIAGRLISGVEDRSLLSQHGTVGLQIRRLQDVRHAWADHAVLVLHSDGIVSRWSVPHAAGLLQCDPAVIAGWLIRDHLRGRDDATVVVVRRS
ncbi:Serine/threonine-protein kinase RsbT [Burkholderiaceae bacterium]|nr:Serine/threonine-protein kinase RsbT [Burkholderiaceae bacterium]